MPVFFSLGCSNKNLSSEEVDTKPKSKKKTVLELEVSSQSELTVNQRKKLVINDSLVGLENFSTIKAHSAGVTAFTVSKAGFEAYSGDADGVIVRSQFLELGKKEALFKTDWFALSNRAILSLALSDDQSLLAVGQYSQVWIVDIKKRQIVNKLTRIRGRITEIAFGPDNSLVVLGTASGRVYAWNLLDGEKAGEDSDLAIEEYPGTNSQITSLLVHPAGRIFFASTKSGKVIVWRLIRTEYQMGLRDTNALADSVRVQKSFRSLIELASEIIFAKLSADGSTLLLGTSLGQIKQWKIRGVVPEKETLSPQVISLASLRAENKELLVTASRGQKLKFWCTDFDELKTITSELLPSSIYEIQSGPFGPLLWVAEKTGNLSVFDSRQLFSDSKLRNLLNDC